MSTRKLIARAGKLLFAATGILAIGWIIGFPGRALLVTFIVYASWHFVNAWRLLSWLQNLDRKQPGAFGIWADIYQMISSLDEQNTQQKTLYQSTIKELRRVLNTFSDASLIVDRNANLSWFNDAAGTMLGLRRPNDIGRPITNLIRSKDFNDWLTTRADENQRLEIPAPENTQNWLDIGAVSIQGDKQLVIFRDISDLHHVERIRRDFVTNVSHELRTPLTVMRGYLELLQERPADELSEIIDRMHTQAMQMQTMLDDLLELSRLQAVESHEADEMVDIPAMLAELKEQAEEISRGKHSLVFDVDNHLMLRGMKADLESAFRNLVINALKYTPEGGTITVSWRNSDEGPALTVSDTGIGIPQREIPRLTERFYRVGSDRGRETGGTGIGLAIVKHVLNGHQARLAIESVFGVGSQFQCIFPSERLTD